MKFYRENSSNLVIKFIKNYWDIIHDIPNRNRDIYLMLFGYKYNKNSVYDPNLFKIFSGKPKSLFPHN